MWRVISSGFVKELKKSVLPDRSGSLLRYSTFNQRKNTGYLRNIVGSVAVTGITYYGIWRSSTGSRTLTLNNAECEAATKETDDQITLYQFASCPFCNKVRTFLDYYGLQYNIVEVDPLLKKEIKFSQHRKVPIVIIKDIQVSIYRK